MALGFKTSLKDGMHYLVGVFDEASDFKPLKIAPRPLRLNLSGIKSVNSLGVRLYIKFMTELANDDVELHECSAVIVEMINTFPATLGSPPEAGRVRSLWVPYWCRACARDFGLLLQTEEFVACESRFPAKTCPRCTAKLECQADPTDLLLFVHNPD